MRRYKTVIWDWNGTLLNDARLGHRVLASMCEKRLMNVPTFEQYQYFYEHPIELIYQRAGFDLQRESITMLCEEWHSQYAAQLGEVGLHSDAKALLEVFEQAGARQVVLSALPHELLLQSIEAAQVGAHFEAVQGLADTLGRSKVENGRQLIDQLGPDPQRTVLIGDSSHDVETAQALGITCLLVSRGFEHREKLLRHGVRVIDDFAPILADFAGI